MEETGKIIISVIYLALFIAAVLGNVFVVCLVLKKPAMKSPTNLLLVNMAAADLLFAVFMFPLAVIRYHVRALWIGGPFGDFTCHVMFFMSHLPIAGSTTTLTFIAFERFFAIVYPYRTIRIFQKVWAITISIWLSSAILMSPVGISAVTTEINGKMQCDRDWSIFGDPMMVKRMFYNTTFVAMYADPLLVIAVLYTAICRKLWKHNAPGQRGPLHARQNNTLHKRQIVTMLISIVIVFALCWLPTHVQHILLSHFPTVHARFPLFVMVSMNLMGHINPAINPLILVVLSNRFRREFFKLLPRKRTARNRTAPLEESPNVSEDMRVQENGINSAAGLCTERLGPGMGC
ncbi:allatostatin-A receptor-like [Stylophora pistillata]|nr:allatostatin-A receptor-like [Stylophora pistillata]